MLNEQQIDSLQWIISVLEKHQIPFQIAGGLAAKIYGSSRPLNDIDIDIPQNRIAEIVDDVKDFITYGPVQHIDEKWDVFVVALERNGQEFDISGAEGAKIHDDATGVWKEFPTDVTKANWIEFEGMRLPVMQKEELIEYKSFLNGLHQKEDIEAILNS
ncbi:MAG: hypothetical protein JWL88_84 [Parcubacteria group bacterium]|nr:hypothetical protein [Parcubacteria group bacterium]